MSTHPVNNLEYGCHHRPSHHRLGRLWTGLASIILGFVCGLLGIAWWFLNLHNGAFSSSHSVIALFPLSAMMPRDGTLSDAFILFVQYPIYGLVIGVFAFCGYFRYGVVLVLIIHIIAVQIAFGVW